MFSVVIPLYNKKHTIRECIASVLSQSYQDFELLVIDDGSTDNSFQVVSEYSDNRIRIVQQSNGGVSSARNLGLKLAKSKYVALLDADDLWMPDYLEKMNSFIESYPFVLSMVHDNMLWMEKDTRSYLILWGKNSFIYFTKKNTLNMLQMQFYFILPR